MTEMPDFESMSDEELRERRRTHVHGYVLEDSVENEVKHAKLAGNIKDELDRRGADYESDSELIERANEEKQ